MRLIKDMTEHGIADSLMSYPFNNFDQSASEALASHLIECRPYEVFSVEEISREFGMYHGYVDAASKLFSKTFETEEDAEAFLDENGISVPYEGGILFDYNKQ